MATIKEANELRKKNPNLTQREAIAQVEGNVGTQPIAPTVSSIVNAPAGVPPAINQPPTPSQPLPEARTGDVVIGVNGERFIQANNKDMSTGVTGPGQVVNQSGQDLSRLQQIQAESFGRREGANIAPIAPVQQAEQTLPKYPEAPTSMRAGLSDQEIINSGGRVVNGMQQMTAKLINEGDTIQSWNSIPGNIEYKGKKEVDPVLNQVFEDAKNGVVRTPEFYSNLRNGVNPTPPPNAEAYFTSIANKIPVADAQKLSPEYKVAQNRYMKANMYSTMTPSQLSQDMSEGKVIEGSQLWEDLKSMNPKLVQDTSNLRIVNGAKTNIYSVDKQGNRVNNLEKTFAEDYLGNYGAFLEDLFKTQSAEEIRAIIYTPDVREAEAKATEYEEEMNQIEADMEEVDRIVAEELAGSGASGTRKRIQASIDKERLQKQYNSTLKSYTTYANKANNLINQNTSVYQSQQTQENARKQALASAGGQVFQNEMQKENTLQQQQNARENLLLQESLAQSRASFQTIGDKVYKVQNGQMTDTGIKAERDAQYQAYGGKLYKVKGDSITEVPGISTATPTGAQFTTIGYDSNGKPVMGFVNESTGSVSPYGSIGGGIQPSGNIVPVKAGNKTVRLDQSGASGFENAINQLKAQGLDIVVGEGFRNQTETIKSMADRHGIPFNASNPAETAQKLRSAGHQVADPGKSNHESGMAIDVYANGNFDPVTPEQEKILNANGWYSAGIPGDAGHFEYRGGGAPMTQGGYSQDDYFNVLFNSLPAGAKDNAGEVKRIREASDKYMKEGISPNQALLRFKGFKLTDESKADLGAEYITIGDNLGKLKPASYETTVAKYINNNDMKGLNTYIEKLADDRAKDQYGADTILSSNVKIGNDRTDKLVSLIEKNKDKIGAFDGYVSDFLQKFKNDPEYQQIKTILQMSQADARKYFAGSAVTETEMKALQDFIGGTTKMTPEALVTMLNTLKEDRQSTYNYQRSGLIPSKTSSVKQKLGGLSLTELLSKLQ